MPSDLRKLMSEELLKGHELMKQLQFILSHDQSSSDFEDVPVDDLVMKISQTFSNSISILERADSDEVSQLGSPCWDTNSNRKSEDSGESSKSTSHTVKDRRGCYKRRKAAHSWTRDTSDLVDDGHAWRKYGQKVILNCKFPRNYFRCTHKYDQLCQATKQVQRIEETPSKYRTTYYGNHTCKNLFGASHQIILEYPDCTDNNSKLLNFGCGNNNNGNNNNISLRQDNHFFGSYSPLSVKKESKDELLHDRDENKINVIYNNNVEHKSSSYYHLSADDLSNFDDLSGINSSSCTTSAHSFDFSMLNGRFDEDDELLQNVF